MKQKGISTLELLCSLTIMASFAGYYTIATTNKATEQVNDFVKQVYKVQCAPIESEE
jgi:CHASE3 domain sensor protein